MIGVCNHVPGVACRVCTPSHRRWWEWSPPAGAPTVPELVRLRAELAQVRKERDLAVSTLRVALRTLDEAIWNTQAVSNTLQATLDRIEGGEL